MGERDIKRILKESKKRYDKVMQEFNQHSREFDKKISEIKTNL